MDEPTALPIILKAIHFAAGKHRDQRRKDVEASPYINHPIEVVELLAQVGGVQDLITLQAAILHDTIEDTDTKPEELDAAFGSDVRRVVEEVSDDKTLPKEERKRLQIEHAPHLSERAKQVKLADLVCNVRSIAQSPPASWPRARQRAYLDWAGRVAAGLRGCNASLERLYLSVLESGKAALGPEPADQVEVREVTAGLWIWRTEHPDWTPDQGWSPVVASTCVESAGETLVLDPLAPPAGAEAVWRRLDARRPTAIVVLKPDHVRDVDLFVRRYRVPAFGPDRFDRHDIPETDLTPIYPGSLLPGGIVALHDGRGRGETPLWLPEQRTLVFADALTAPGGELRVWNTPWHRERAVPALRKLLELPFEHVIVSHGEPVHTRAAYERALESDPWAG